MQPRNAIFSIEVSEAGKLTDCSCVQPLNAIIGIVSTPSGIAACPLASTMLQPTSQQVATLLPRVVSAPATSCCPVVEQSKSVLESVLPEHHLHFS